MKNLKYIIIVIIAATYFTGCGDEKKEESFVKENNKEVTEPGLIKVTGEQFQESGMLLKTLEEKRFPVLISATGMIDVPPQNKAVISTFAGGYIKKTYLLVGDKVKKGQLLVQLEDPQFVEIQQNYLEAKEKLSYLKSEYERQKTLYNEKISSQKKYLKAETDYKVTLARYNGLKKKLQLLNISSTQVEQGNISSFISIYAPIGGYVTKINISMGAYVSPSDEIMEIVNTDHFHIELNVFEKDIMKVKKGQKIRFTIPEASSESFLAVVHLVGSSVSQGNRTVKVHGHLMDDIERKLSTGMFVEAQIFAEESVYKALPERAVVSINDENYVLRLKEKRLDDYIFEKKLVKVGMNSNGYIQIINETDFKDSDKFLVKGAFNLITE